MSIRAVTPPQFAEAAEAAAMSPAVVSGDHLFLTGVTGSDRQGQIPGNPRDQFRSAFEKIGLVLEQEGLGFEALVDMTSYHIGLREHFDLFDQTRRDYCRSPYPAWTAVEVAGLRREGAIVEIRAVAHRNGVGGNYATA